MSLATRFQSNLRRLQTRQGLRLVLPMAFVTVLVGSVMITQFIDLPSFSSDKSPAEAAADYRKGLQAQVDNEDGSPVSGRDPSAQAQTSLAAAASTPTGTGMRTATPAAGVPKDHVGHQHGTSSADVYGTTAQQRESGINSAGCFYDYGTPGSQCVPAYLANADGKLECSAVRKQFADGVKVSGNDRFGLDGNRDGIACGKAD